MRYWIIGKSYGVSKAFVIQNTATAKKQQQWFQVLPTSPDTIILMIHDIQTMIVPGIFKIMLISCQIDKISSCHKIICTGEC